MAPQTHPASASMPPIRYTLTKDGVRIAFYTLGSGPACIVLFAYHVNHLELNWRVALHRSGVEFLTRHFTVVALDLRGAGLSQRRIDGLSLDSFQGDIEAVLAAAGIDRVAICAMGPSASIALSGPLTAGAEVREVPERHTPAPDAKDLKSVLLNWTRNLGMLKGHDEREMVATLEYQGTGAIRWTARHARYRRASTNYQSFSQRIQYACTLDTFWLGANPSTLFEGGAARSARRP